MKNLLNRLWKDDEGAELVEWVVIVALIAAAAIATYTLLKTAISTEMVDVLSRVSTAN